MLFPTLPVIVPLTVIIYYYAGSEHRCGASYAPKDLSRENSSWTHCEIDIAFFGIRQVKISYLEILSI